jgi:hypothetical protein
MRLIYQQSYATVHWYNASETVLLTQLALTYTWDEVNVLLGIINSELGSKDHPTYSIICFADDASSILPKGFNLRSILELVKADPSHEELTFFVGNYGMLKTFIDLIPRIYGIQNVIIKYRFAATLEEAVDEISRHQRPEAPS